MQSGPIRQNSHNRSGIASSLLLTLALSLGLYAIAGVKASTAQAHLAVEATNNNAETDAAMQCWIDFDRNGVFNNPGETSGVTTVAAGSGTGTYSLSFSGFSTPTPGVSFIRCRIAFVATEVSEPQGTAYSGEIEDHMVQISDENSPVIR